MQISYYSTLLESNGILYILNDASRTTVSQSCLICVSQLDDVIFLTFKSAEYIATVVNISKINLQGK